MGTRLHNQKLLAQNFLRSPKLVRRLVRVSGIGPSDTVYEIGPGNGIITAALASIAGRVIAIEKDPDLVRCLRQRFRVLGNVEIVQKDFLDYSFPSQPSDFKIFASIPYNVTAQILRKILNERSNLSEGFLIMQKEAAKKISGLPKQTLVATLAQPFFEFQILFQLRRTDFWPVPNVNSVLLQIKRRSRSQIEVNEVAQYRAFVQYGFERWKPNLRLAFKKVFSYKQWKRLAGGLGIPLNATPTDLSFEQWLGLYRGFREQMSRNVRDTEHA
jgi:23S rRNA (adenine-N6)-dimethyltransferase